MIRRLARIASHPLRWASLGAVLLACQTPAEALAQTVYNYAGTKSTATWSTPGTWTPASGTDTTYPGSDGTNTADTANIVNVPITTTLTYDVGATGYVGTLNMTQNTTNVGTTLQLAQNLTLNQGGSITSSLNANSLETVNLGNFMLTVGGAANLTLGSASATTLGGGTPITTTGNGAVAINGTVTVASAVTLLETINAPVTLNGGTITINDNGSAVKNVLTLTGNFASTGNAVLPGDWCQRRGGHHRLPGGEHDDQRRNHDGGQPPRFRSLTPVPPPRPRTSIWAHSCRTRW